MNMIEDLVLNLILVVFPVLIYFIYNCYREVCMEKYNNLLLNISLVSSMYFYFKYGNVENNAMGMLVCNLPIIVAYLKKQSSTAILLSLIVVMYSYFLLDMSIIIVIKYLSYYILFLFGKKYDFKDNIFILLIAMLQGFFLSFEYLFLSGLDNFSSFLEILFLCFLFYLLPFCLLYLFNLADRITSLFLSLSELERDKQLKNSLFKITHEVKNPIAVCLGYLDMLDINNRDHLERYIPIINQELNRSLDIMNDFMEFSKIKIDKDIIDINMLLEGIEDEMKILLNGRDIGYNSNLIDSDIYVMGDYNRLKQVFLNLIKNSMEAIEGGGMIDICTYVIKNFYCIEIIDNGSGMDYETLSSIKDMFFTTKVRGSGLGVSLSNEIIKAHQGSLDYFSEVGKGTKVVVKLPVAVL